MSGKQKEWCIIGVCERECVGHCPRDEPLTLRRIHSHELPQLYEALEGWKSVCDQKGKIYFFSFLLALLIFFCSFHGRMHANPVVVGSGDV